jgi:hypothetical protein
MGYDDVNLAREKIQEWLKLIVMIKSGSENAESVESVNIADQTLYLNIISSACIDRSERGVQKIQNLVCNDIFSIYGQGLKSGLLNFGVQKNKNKAD